MDKLSKAIEKMEQLTGRKSLKIDGETLTENKGRDGNNYLWFIDTIEFVINIDTLEVLTKDEIEEYLL